jgi:hypothetical protein
VLGILHYARVTNCDRRRLLLMSGVVRALQRPDLLPAPRPVHLSARLAYGAVDTTRRGTSMPRFATMVLVAVS